MVFWFKAKIFTSQREKLKIISWNREAAKSN
jgi:hypothetical protein